MEAALALFLEAGLPGAVAVLAILGCVKLYADLGRVRTEHLTDLRAIQTVVEAVKVQLVATEQALRSAVDYIKGGSK